MKKLLFVLNPHAGKARVKGKLSWIVDYYIKQGFRVEVYMTQEQGDGARVIGELAGEVDHLVVSGGDGTMNEAVTGLMRLPKEKRPSLGYIPAGTTNDFARSLNLPKNIGKAAESSVLLPACPTDIGQFEDAYFTYVAGFGAFTSVSFRTSQDSKNMLGHQAYIFEGLKKISEIKSQHVKVFYKDQELEDDFLVGLVTNSVSVAGFKKISGPDVELDDGLFEVVLIRDPKNPLDLTRVVQELFLDEANQSFVLRFKTDAVRFVSEEPIDWVLDGEFGGSKKEVDIRICKNAIDIVRK